MNQGIVDHDVVALTRDIPADGLVAGDTGTVVLIHQGGKAYEVEFPTSDGKPRFIVVTVEANHLLKLRNFHQLTRLAG